MHLASTSNNACINNNYLFSSSSHQWTITSCSIDTYYVHVMYTGWVVILYCANDSSFAVRPVLYLETTVKITSGKGTETEPYRLSL